MLAEDPRDDEARALLARLDAWSGRTPEAIAGYRAVLRRHPGDVEVRAGLVDVLTWAGRWAEADRLIDAGLAVADDAGLWARRARLAAWRNDAATASRAIERALELAPDDADVRALGDRIFEGEARFDVFRDLYARGGLQGWGTRIGLLQKWGRFTFVAGAEQAHRSGFNNGLYTFGAMRTVDPHLEIGGEVALGAPVLSYPWAIARAIAAFPRLGPVSASLTASALRYLRGRWVYSVAPLVSVPLGDELRLDTVLWLEVIHLPATTVLRSETDLLVAFGAQLVWTPTSRLQISTMWTEGAGVDEVDGLYERLSATTQTLRVSLDWLAHRRFGMGPRWRVEVRTDERGVRIPLHRLEVSTWARW